MTEKTTFVAERASRHPQTDRVELVEDILVTLTEDDPDRNVVWADRLAAYDPGEIEAFDVDDEVMVQLGVKYDWA